MREYNVEQRSPEWFKLRMGVITASSTDNILYESKQKPYLYQLLAEITTGIPNYIPLTDPMKWGIEHEDDARQWYESTQKVSVRQTGFCKPDDKEYVGCSPDGIVGAKGLIEIKCPGSKKHISNMHGVKDYSNINQTQFQMWIMDKDWCDLVSYDPRMPEHIRGYILRVYRNDEKIKKIAEAADGMYADIMKFCKKHNITPYA